MGAGEGANVMYNKEKMAEYHKKWYEANKEKKAEYDKRYYDDNKEKKAEYDKRHYEVNKERISKRKIVEEYKKWNGFAPPAEYVEVKYIINKTNNLLKQKVS